MNPKIQDQNKISNFISFLRQYGAFYLTGILILLGMKLFNSRAGADDLRWLLAPTSRWVTMLCGIPFTYEPGAGYLSGDRRFLIAPACSGIQFMMILTTVLIFSFVHRMGGSRKRCLGWTLFSLAVSYPLTVLVNGLRILLAIYLPPWFASRSLYRGALTPERLHTAIGVAVYFTALLILHRLADTATENTACSVMAEPAGMLSKCPLPRGKHLLLKLFQPVFWYFFLVLGIPFLNRAQQKNGRAFTEYAALISLVCGAILIQVILYRIVKCGLLSRKSKT